MERRFLLWFQFSLQLYLEYLDREGIVNTVAMACSGLYAEGRAAATGAKPWHVLCYQDWQESRGSYSSSSSCYSFKPELPLARAVWVNHAGRVTVVVLRLKPTQPGDFAGPGPKLPSMVLSPPADNPGSGLKVFFVLVVFSSFTVTVASCHGHCPVLTVTRRKGWFSYRKSISWIMYVFFVSSARFTNRDPPSICL